jgi:hypothetical protein
MDDFARNHELDMVDTTDLTPVQAAIKIVEWHNFISA